MNLEAAPLDRSQRSAARLRRDPRLPVALTCQLRIGTGPWRPATLVDMSRWGFRIAWLPSSAVGRSLWVRIPGLEAMPATIRWRDLGGVGCKFERPLSEIVIEHLARKASPQG
jgi:hypothetical protein